MLEVRALPPELMGTPSDREWLSGYRALGDREILDLERIRGLLEGERDPWDRSLALHLTGSAVVIHPPTGDVLLRWHERQGGWRQVGGHGDPGETDPLQVALREAAEETGLEDLGTWPDGEGAKPVHIVPIHVVIVPVTPRGAEPAHEHADVRYVLATGSPDKTRAEKPTAPLRWVTLPEALSTTPANLAETLRRIGRRLGDQDRPRTVTGR